MLDGLKNKLRKFLGLEAKPDAEDDEAKAKLKQDIKSEVEAQSKPAEEAKKAADAAAEEENGRQPEALRRRREEDRLQLRHEVHRRHDPDAGWLYRTAPDRYAGHGQCQLYQGRAAGHQ